MLSFLKRAISWETISAGLHNGRASTIAREVVRLLISDRDGWVRTESYLIHSASGVAIWTRNEEYGLHLECGMECSSGYWRATKPKIELTKMERRAIYNAAQWEKFDREEAEWKLGAH